MSRQLAWCCIALAASLGSGFARTVRAETRRALLVGIDVYAPDSTVSTVAEPAPATTRRWSNLEGAVNDATALAEILVARYGFEARDILVLQNAAATRAAILAAFRSHLVQSARPGDVCFFYYAGHGSQVVTTNCSESDCRDETVVPADSWTGAADIRDKEWQTLFNDALDRGAVLTVIFDSCHSGSISRGLSFPGKSRYLVPDSRPVAAIVADRRGLPSQRGALVLSAAQEFQSADEVVDEQGNPHGLFSLAFMRTIRTMPVHEPVRNVFRRVRALMLSSGWRPQEPRLEAEPARRAAPLFGSDDGSSTVTTVAVERVTPDGSVVLQGGLALGLCTGSELRRRAQAATPPTARDQRLRVETIVGLNRCQARMVDGNPADVRIGDLFELDVWAGCDRAFLSVWMPPANLARAAVERVAHDLATLRRTAGITWIEDPTTRTPTHIVAWDGRTWRLEVVDNRQHVDLGTTPTRSAILAALLGSPAGQGDKIGGSAGTAGATGVPREGSDVRLFVHLPPPVELEAQLAFAPRESRSPIDVRNDPGAAHYFLVGRIPASGTMEYAWVRPQMTTADAEMGCPLPARSDWCALAGSAAPRETARQLQDLALRIGRVRTWMQLEPPADNGRFPYELVLMDPVAARAETPPVVYDGEIFRLALRRTRGASVVERRFVYIFAILCNGEIRRLWGDADNYLPASNASTDSLIVLHGGEVKISEPFGVDTYVLLTTKEPIDADAIAGDAVVSRGGSGDVSPLARLLGDFGNTTRGMRVTSAADWSLQRLSILSAPAAPERR